MVWDSITTTYLKVDFDDSLIYHHLLNQFNNSNFTLLSYAEAKALSQEVYLPFIHIKNIQLNDSIIYCLFSFNHWYKSKEDPTQKSVYPSFHLAARKISQLANTQDLLNIQSYSSFYFFDSISLNGESFSPISHAAKDFKIIENSLWIKMDRINFKERKTSYAGLAHIEISSNGSLNMIDLDTSLLENQWFDVIKYGDTFLKIYEDIADTVDIASLRLEKNILHYMGPYEGRSFHPVYSQTNDLMQLKLITSNKQVVVFTLDSIIEDTIYHPTAINKLPFSPVETFIGKNGRLTLLSKEMINEEYNYGEIRVVEIAE